MRAILDTVGQSDMLGSEKLIVHCVVRSHWSPFPMVFNPSDKHTYNFCDTPCQTPKQYKLSGVFVNIWRLLGILVSMFNWWIYCTQPGITACK